jgi:hypothetical protein
MTVRQVIYQSVSRSNILPANVSPFVQWPAPGRGSPFIQRPAPGGFRTLGPVMVRSTIIPGTLIPIPHPGVTVDVVSRAELFPMSTPGVSARVALPPMLVPVSAPRVACYAPAPGPAATSRGNKEHRGEYAQE